MSKYSVKRPFTVLVGIVLILVLGFVSFSKMTTDLLPNMSLPYVLVITSYPGASPEKIETSVTEVLESGLGTVNGVENVTSVSNENVSMVVLEFDDDTDMDSAMVRLSSQLDQLTLPDEAGTPMLMEISPDLMATMMVTADYDGMDEFELTDFTKDTLAPYLERQTGVASVDVSGYIEQTVEVRLNQDKIDEVNEKLVAKVNGDLADSEQEIADAKEELADAKAELKSQKKKLEQEQEDTNSELAKYSKLMDEAVATQKAYEANLTSLKASRTALKTEKSEYKKAYKQINSSLKSIPVTIRAAAANEILSNLTEEQRELMDLPESVDASDKKAVNACWKKLKKIESFSQAVAQTDALIETLPTDIDDALANDGAKLAALQAVLKESGMEEEAAQLTAENLTTVQTGYDTRIPEIDIELGNLKTEIAAAEAALEQINEAVEEATSKYEEVEAGKLTAAASFGSALAQIAAGETQIESGESELDDAQDSLDDAKKTALDNANLDQMLTLDTLSAMISAENFDMPAGYIEEDGESVLIKVGEQYDSIEELEGTVLTNIDEIGDVALSDVADVTLTDNQGESYAKVNGNQALLISITKSSTAGTSAVSGTCNEAMEELMEQYPGLHLTALMDQGEYIGLIVDAVISNLLWGALLAIVVLILFLKDPRPTVVVAFSIPLSVLFAIVLMYFTDITLNVISLSGLSLGVGMLVDNSIVVMENIYRMRSLGVPAARAAVKGTKQVAGAILASTLTTVCVFLPIVFTTGLTRQLFADMGLTIAYSLGASLIVAMTVVPAMSATALKSVGERPHRIFDAAMEGYEKILRFCLRVKLVPLALAVVLLAFCAWRVTSMGMVLIPDMGGTQMSMTMTSPEGTSQDDAYAKADELMETLTGISGVETVGMMDGSAGISLLTGSGSSSDTVSFTVYMILDEETGDDNSVVEDQIDAYFEGSDWTYSVSASNMDLSSLLGSGMEIEIKGNDLDTLSEIGGDVKEILAQVEGFENISDGQEDASESVKVIVDKNKAMRLGLTVAQVYQEIAEKITTEESSTTLTVGEKDYEVEIVNENDPLTLANLPDMEFETTTTDDDGSEVTETHTLSEFAEVEETPGVASISRSNQSRYLTVTADTMDGYNTTLLSREVEKLLADYEVPEGYELSITGETESVQESMTEIVKMIGLAIVFIYLIMVAQFQSLLSPFIVLFTIPLAFTGGLLGLLLTGEELSLIAMMGFLVLAGVVVNNGIVFVDYANQLRLSGMEKREALVRTGKTRMRPILMTALTTVMAMFTMALDDSAAASMGRGMAIVAIGGLSYATLMTLFIVPVLYDLLFRRELTEVDFGDLETLDDDGVL